MLPLGRKGVVSHSRAIINPEGQIAIGENGKPHFSRKERARNGAPSLIFARVGLSDLFAPGFEILLHQRHELVCNGAVDEAVVVAEREVNDRADGNGVGAVIVGDHHGLLGNSAGPHDGGVRLVDDRQAKDSAELAGIGDGESGTFNVLGLELLGAGALAQVSNTAL